MEKPRNIYKLDDFCLVLAALLVLPLLWLCWPFISRLSSSGLASIAGLLEEMPGRWWFATGLNLFSIIFFALVGVVVRRKEQAMLAIIGMLLDYRQLRIGAIASETGLSEQRISAAIKAISKTGLVTIESNGDQVIVVERKQPGAAEAASPDQTPESAWDQSIIKQDLKEGMDTLVRAFTPRPISGSPATWFAGMNIPVFIFLLLFFWPIAIGYAASVYLRNQNRNQVSTRLPDRHKPDEP